MRPGYPAVWGGGCRESIDYKRAKAPPRLINGSATLLKRDGEFQEACMLSSVWPAASLRHSSGTSGTSDSGQQGLSSPTRRSPRPGPQAETSRAASNMPGMSVLANGDTRIMTIHEMRAQEAQKQSSSRDTDAKNTRPHPPCRPMPADVWDLAPTFAIGGGLWSSSNRMPENQLAVSRPTAPFRALRSRVWFQPRMVPKRTTDSLSLYANALGTEHGNVHSYVPGNEKLRMWYHFDDDAYTRAERERSAETERQQQEKLQNLGQRPITTESILTYPRRRPMSGRNHFTEKEKELLVLEESQRPSWARIEQNYKYDWVVTRDRDLAAPVESSVLKMQTNLRENSGLSLQSFSFIPSIASSRATEVEEITKRTIPRTRLTFNIPATPDGGWSCKTSSNAAEVDHDHLVPWPLPPSSRPSAAAAVPQNGPLSPHIRPTSGRPGPGTHKTNDSRVEHDAFRFRPLCSEDRKPKVSCLSYNNLSNRSQSKLVQVASGRYVAVEAPRTPLTLAQTKLNASDVIQTGSPIRRWQSKEGLQDVEWDEFADLEGVERDPGGHLRARKALTPW